MRQKTEVPAPEMIFGTWPLTGDVARAATEMAISVGYQSIDTAQWYENEGEVGAAVKSSGRSDIRVSTKVKPENLCKSSFLPSVRRSLDELGMERVDTLFMHWPPKTLQQFDEALDCLNEAQIHGYCKNIALSNATTALLERAVMRTSVPIKVNQIEFHPLINQMKVRRSCRQHRISVEGYCSLGRGEALNQKVTSEIAEAHGMAESSVILAWTLSQGVSPLTMTTKRQNAETNMAAKSIALSQTEIQQISSLQQRHLRIVDIPELNPVWDAP